jgi:fructosamine-3-kinase
MTETSLGAILQEALRRAGDSSAIQNVQPVAGGCINNAQQVTTSKHHYLFKYNAHPLPGMFSTEAQGLELLRQTKTLRVPELFAFADALDGQPGWMLQEWIESTPGEGSAHAGRLGAGLATLHQATAATYGLDHDNYLGLTPQENAQDTDWVRFFRGRRLRPQIALADRNGWLTIDQRNRLEWLVERIDNWLGDVDRQPALLHGDLWAGNILYSPDGQPALIDPAIYYGDREAELAYGEWFTPFPPAFYAAYDEVWPTEPDRADRRDLYNLYHALNHVNHFGERYLSEVERILQRYVG